jgi:hypothetical protein
LKAWSSNMARVWWVTAVRNINKSSSFILNNLRDVSCSIVTDFKSALVLKDKIKDYDRWIEVLSFILWTSYLLNLHRSSLI